MMGVKDRVFDPLPRNFSLEDLVPRDNFYRCLEERIDLASSRRGTWWRIISTNSSKSPPRPER